MISLRRAWNWLADLEGLVKKSARLSAVRTKGTSISKDSTMSRTKKWRRPPDTTCRCGTQDRELEERESGLDDCHERCNHNVDTEYTNWDPTPTRQAQATASRDRHLQRTNYTVLTHTDEHTLRTAEMLRTRTDRHHVAHVASGKGSSSDGPKVRGTREPK